METNIIYQTDALSGLCLLDDNSIDCIVTSPPYWQLRDYGIDGIEWADGWFGQLGMEPTREEYISHLLMVFGECKRVLKPSGTLWVNIGYYRSGYNTNGGKRTVYSELYGAPAGLRELHPQGRNKRAVWRVASESSREKHFASFPAKLIATPIEAGCPCGGIVLDIFMGSGTTAIVAKRLGRQFIGFEPNPVYVKICNRRLQNSFNNNVKKYKHEKD